MVAVGVLEAEPVELLDLDEVDDPEVEEVECDDDVELLAVVKAESVTEVDGIEETLRPGRSAA